MLRSSLHCSFNSGSSSSLDCLTVMPLANTVSTRNLQGCRTRVIKNDQLLCVCVCVCQSLAKVECGVSLPPIHSLVAGTPSPCIRPFSELYPGGSLSEGKADGSTLGSPLRPQRKPTSPRKRSAEADLVVVGERGERFVEPDALKLLVVGVHPKHFELRGGDSHIRLQVLFKCC